MSVEMRNLLACVWEIGPAGIVTLTRMLLFGLLLSRQSDSHQGMAERALGKANMVEGLGGFGEWI